MMKIDTVFDVGQTVFFIDNGGVQEAEVEAIQLRIAKPDFKAKEYMRGRVKDPFDESSLGVRYFTNKGGRHIAKGLFASRQALANAIVDGTFDAGSPANSELPTTEVGNQPTITGSPK